MTLRRRGKKSSRRRNRKPKLRYGISAGQKVDIHHISHICQEFEKNWEESRQGRVDSWLNFKGVTPKVSAPAAMGPGQARQQQQQQLPGALRRCSDQRDKKPFLVFSLVFIPDSSRWRKS